MSERLDLQRRFFAEEVQAVCNLRTPQLVEALATVPREAFLPPGPWTIRAEGDYGGPPRQTPDASPRHIYHNISVAIDPARQLFNGAPGVVAMCIDALGLEPGDAVLHVGCGRGYYSAIIAECVGSSGRLTAIDIDPDLAAEAAAGLASRAHVEARQGNGVEGIPAAAYDAILVNAGVTHPHGAWLRALKPRGRIVLPLTFTMPQMGAIGKGVIAVLRDTGSPESLEARVLTMTAIYSAVGIRDAALNDKLASAFMHGAWPVFTRLRRDAHEAAPACWLHGEGFCLSA